MNLACIRADRIGADKSAGIKTARWKKYAWYLGTRPTTVGGAFKRGALVALFSAIYSYNDSPGR